MFDVSPNGAHIAIITYSTNPILEIGFNRYSKEKLTGEKIKQEIENFILQRGDTRIDKALKLAGRQFSKENGVRENVKKVNKGTKKYTNYACEIVV